MSGNDLLALLRSLLRDTHRGMATKATFYDDATLLRGINRSVQEVARALITRIPRAEISVAKLLSVDTSATAGFPGSEVKDDYWFLECGFFTDGLGRTQYVPATSIEYGTRTRYMNQQSMFTQGRSYYGAGFTNVLYWRLPKTVTASNAPLTDFTDSVYHVAKLKAACDLVAQDDHDALDRWTALTGDFNAAITSLK